jgi:hypothetical protein
MANWNLEGLMVEGLYLGDIPVVGKVKLSRVKYGGGVSHHIVLSASLELFGKTREVGQGIILDHEQVTRVFG